MRIDNCYRAFYGIVLVLMLLDTGPLNAQEVKDNLLFGYLPIELVKSAKQISFPVDQLSADAPDWKLDSWSINLANREIANQRLLKRVDQKIARLDQLYQLTPVQKEKLLAAAKVDISRFWRAIDRPTIAENRFGRLGIRGAIELRVKCDFFYEHSLFSRVLSASLTSLQHQHRDETVLKLNRQWLEQADSAQILDWLVWQAQLSTGQRARLKSLIGQHSLTNAGEIARFRSIDKYQWHSLLNEGQIEKVVSTLDLFCDAPR